MNITKNDWFFSKTKYGYIFIPLLMVTIVVLIVCGTAVPICSYFAFILTVLYLVFSNNEQAVCIMFFLLPFANIFKYDINSVSFFTYLTIILALKLIIAKRHIKFNFIAIWVILLFIQIVGSHMDYRILIKQAVILLLVYGYFQCCRPIVKQVVVNLSFGIFLSCCVANMTALFPSISDYMRVVRAYEISLDTYRFTGLYSDPNYLSQTLILLIMSFLVLMQIGKIKKIGLLMCVIFVLFGLQTISKSFVLMLVIVIGLITLLSFKKRNYKLVVAIFICALITLVVVEMANIKVIDYIFARFSYNGDITTGRVDLWKQYLILIFKEPLKLIFGYGIGSNAVGYMAHSTYLDCLYYYGVLGTVLFIIGIRIAVGKRNLRFNLLGYAVLICYCFTSAFLSNLLMYDFAYSLILVLAFISDESLMVIREEGYND